MKTLKQVQARDSFHRQVRSALIWSAVASAARHRFRLTNSQLKIEKNPKRRRRFALPAHSKIGQYRQVLLLTIFLLVLAANAPGLSAQMTAQAKASQPTQATLRGTLKTSFGSAVEVVTAFKPFYLTGDFNGDGSQDVLIVVRIKGPRTELESDVKIYNPFERPKAVYPEDPVANPTLALAIIHGSRPGWQTPPALEKFLLFGETPILILNNARATSSESVDKKSLMELLTKRSTRYKGDGWPPTAAKGDSIVLGTEATDSILYWNGKNYRWEEAAGGE